MELPSGRAALCLSTSSFPGVPLAVQLKHASLGHAGPGPHDLTGVTHGVQMTSQEPLPRGAHLCLAPGSCGLSALREALTCQGANAQRVRAWPHAHPLPTPRPRQQQAEGLPQLCFLKRKFLGNSLVVQWLRLQASDAGGMGSTPGRGTKVPTCRVAKTEKNCRWSHRGPPSLCPHRPSDEAVWVSSVAPLTHLLPTVHVCSVAHSCPTL